MPGFVSLQNKKTMKIKFIGPPLFGFCAKCKLYSDLLLMVDGEEANGYWCDPCRGVPESEEQSQYRKRLHGIFTNNLATKTPAIKPGDRPNETLTVNDQKITVRAVQEWLAALPPEWQDAEFNGVACGAPCTIKRLAAITVEGERFVCANQMGTHINPPTSFEHVLHT